MKQILAFVVLGASLSGACGSGASSAQADAQKVAAALSGGGSQGAADNPQCKPFTPAEIAKYIGEPVSAGRDAMGGCQWVTTKTRSDGSQGDVMVIVVPARFHERPSMAKGFKDVADVGEQGFVAQDLGGWVAGAISGKDAVKVVLAGQTASEASAIALLKETVARRAR
jgi:hypothetical protein